MTGAVSYSRGSKGKGGETSESPKNNGEVHVCGWEKVVISFRLVIVVNVPQTY